MKRDLVGMLVGAFLAVIFVFIGQSHFSFQLNFLNLMKLSAALMALVGYLMHRDKNKSGRFISLVLFAVALTYVALNYGWATMLMNEIGFDRSDLPDFEPIIWLTGAIVIALFLIATMSYIHKQTKAATLFIVLFGVALTFSIAGLG